MSTLSDTDFALPLTNLFPNGNPGLAGSTGAPQGGGFSGLLLQAQFAGDQPLENLSETEVTDVSDQKVLQFTEFTDDDVLLDTDNPLQIVVSSNSAVHTEGAPERAQIHAPESAEIDTPEVSAATVMQPQERPVPSVQSRIYESGKQLETQLPGAQLDAGRGAPASVEAASATLTGLNNGDPEVPGALQTRTISAENNLGQQIAGSASVATSIQEHRQASNNGRFDRTVSSVAAPAVTDRSGSIDMNAAAKALSTPELALAKEMQPADQLGQADKNLNQSVSVAAGNGPLTLKSDGIELARAEMQLSGTTRIQLAPEQKENFAGETRTAEMNSLRVSPEISHKIRQAVNIQLATSAPVTTQPTTSAQSMSASVPADLIQEQPDADLFMQDGRSAVRDTDALLFSRSALARNDSPLLQSVGDGITSFRPLTQLVSGATVQSSFNSLQTGLLTTSPGTNPVPDMLTTQLPVSSIAMKQAGWDQSLSTNVAFMLREDISSASIRLKPAELGSMNIQLSVQSDQLNVNIAASNAVTREALEASMPRLREQFASLGFNQVDVNVGNPGHGDRSAHQMANRDENAPDNGYMRQGAASEGEDSEVLIQQQWVSRHNGVLDTFA